ncbi:MAG: PLP-dependent transferase, partial [Verrucomicrobiota bacterium]
FQYADVVTMSLTKFFSGVGDVMAGAMILKNDSPHNQSFKRILDEIYEDDLWGSDAAVLEKNSRDFAARMKKINNHTEAVYDSLKERTDVLERLWYPKGETPELYHAIQREEGGYGGLFSIVLKDPKRCSPRFYNALRVSKGPSLGTNFTLACPYMLLAHYPELEWSDQLGIDRHLLRISIGLEDPEDLIRRFHSALDVL